MKSMDCIIFTFGPMISVSGWTAAGNRARSRASDETL